MADDENALMELSYPVTARDKAICVTAMEITQQAGALLDREHLDLSLLASHPKWCEPFLSATQNASLKDAIRNAPPALFTQPEDSIRWDRCCDKLSRVGALEIKGFGLNRTIEAGKDLVPVKAEFAEDVKEDTSGIVRFALLALEVIHKLRQDLQPATSEQKSILHLFNRLYEDYQKAA